MKEKKCMSGIDITVKFNDGRNYLKCIGMYRIFSLIKCNRNFFQKTHRRMNI